MLRRIINFINKYLPENLRQSDALSRMNIIFEDINEFW